MTLAILALATCGLLGAVPAASASGGDLELLPPGGSFPAEFHIGTPTSNVTMTLNGETVKCLTQPEGEKSLSASGEFTDPDSASVTLTFHNCSAFGTACKSAGQENGTIVSEELPVDVEKLAGGEPGVSFAANESTGRLATFTCAWGLAEFEVLGGGESSPVLSPEEAIENPEQMFWIELGGGESGLQSSLNGGEVEGGAEISSPYASWTFPDGKAEIVDPANGPTWLYGENPEFSVSSEGLSLGWPEGSIAPCSGSAGVHGSGYFFSQNRAVLTLKVGGCGAYRSPGEPKGTIASFPLVAKLVNLSSSETGIGLLLSPLSESGTFMEFSPWSGGGVPNYEITGSMLVEVTEPGTEGSSATVRFTEVGSEDHQLEEGGPEYWLHMSISGGPSEAATIANQNTLTPAEGGEVTFLPAE